jgi:hypothetical protein
MNLSKVLNQTAVYWAPSTNDGWGSSYVSPVEVSVRWTDGQQKFVDDKAEEHISSAYILAETDFAINGRMKLCSLTDLDSAQDPDEEGALLIKGFSKIPDKPANQFLRKAWLV